MIYEYRRFRGRKEEFRRFYVILEKSVIIVVDTYRDFLFSDLRARNENFSFETNSRF